MHAYKLWPLVSVLLCLAVATPRTVLATEGLAITCPTAAEGQPDNPSFGGTFCANQYMQRVLPSDKVLSCLTAADCDFGHAGQQWRTFATLPDTALVHVCGHDAAEGWKACSTATDAAPYADQKIVPKSQVALQPMPGAKEALLEWVAPVVYDDGTPIAPGTLLAYRVNAAAGDTPATALSEVTGLRFTTPALTPNTWHFDVQAQVPGGEWGAGSVKAVKVIVAPVVTPPVTPPASTPTPTPAAPTNLHVIDPTAFRAVVVLGGSGLEFEAGGTVAVGTACIAGASLGGKTVVPSTAATWTTGTAPTLVFANCGTGG